MGARERIEQHSIFLQKFAYRLLTDDNIRLATIGKLVGDHGIFDRDMSTILTLLFAHNNLMSPQIGRKEEQPYALLHLIAKDLERRNFYLPSFRRRFKHVHEITNKTFKQEGPSEHGGGEAGSLDRPLRSLRQKMYEIRLHDAGHADDKQGTPFTKRTGEETTRLVEQLITTVKSLETQGLPYRVTDSGERATKEQTEFLNARYDELATKINAATGTTAEGDKIQLLYLHPQHMRDDPEWFRQMGEESTSNLYGVREEDFSRLIEAIAKARKGWKPLDKYVYVTDLTREPENDVPDQGRKPGAPDTERHSEDRQKQYQEELDVLGGFSQPDSSRVSAGKPVVRVVSLPFAPDQIDDNYPTIELADDRAVGPNMTLVTIENINRMRFAGFVDFDDKYRMMIMWANAPSDENKSAGGHTYRDLLMKVLGVFKHQYGELMGMEPEIHRTKSGASYYFPKPVSVARLVETFNDLRNLINRTNGSIEHYEAEVMLERAFNREINDEELPSYMEESA